MVFSREAGPSKIATFNINNINEMLRVGDRVVIHAAKKADKREAHVVKIVMAVNGMTREWTRNLWRG